MYNLTIVKKVISNKKLTYFLLFLFGVVVLFRPPVDPDFGWHYKYGEYLFQNGRLLRENIFSYTNTDYKWVSSYWIPQALTYLSHSFLGSTIPTIISNALISLIILLILKNHSDDGFSLSFVFVMVVVALSGLAVTVRPLYFSTIFLFLLLHILLKNNGGKKFLPIMFMFWANMHADFLIGLFILGTHSLFVFFEKTKIPTTTVYKIMPLWKNKKNISTYLKLLKNYFVKIAKDKKARIIFFKCFRILFISTLVTLINPYGIELWTTLLKELTQPFKAFVKEWSPISDVSFRNIIISSLASLGAVFSVLPYKKDDQEFKPWYRFLIVFFYLFFIKSAYFLRIVIVLSAFPILQNINHIKNDICKIYKRTFEIFPSFTLNVFLAFILFTVLGVFVNNVFSTASIKKWSEENKYPYGAVFYVKKNPIEGNMLNNYSWGGYLIWQLPEYKTFVDGRMTAWKKDGEYLMDRYRKIYYGTEGNKDLLMNYIDDYNITWTITEPDAKIAKYLKSDGWEVYYEDDISIVLKKLDSVRD